MLRSIFLACFYGLRRSELLGLRWSAIDFETGSISISTTVVKEKIDNQIKTVVRDGITKTESSQRTLPLCSYTYQYFVNLYHAQQYQRNLCGASYNPSYLDFICVDGMGNLLQPDFVSQKFQRLLRQYNLRPIRFHDLRHTFAVHCLNNWVLSDEDLTAALPVLSRYLGHNGLTGTQKYLQLTAQLYPDIVTKLEAQFGGLIPQMEVSDENI